MFFTIDLFELCLSVGDISFLQTSEFLHLQGKYNTQMHPKVFMVSKVYFLCLLVFLHLSYTRLFFFPPFTIAKILFPIDVGGKNV